MCCDDEEKSNKACEQWNKGDSHLAKNSECRENIDGLFKPTRHCENKPNEWMKVWRIQGRRLTTSSEVKSMKPGKIRKSLQMRENNHSPARATNTNVQKFVVCNILFEMFPF